MVRGWEESWGAREENKRLRKEMKCIGSFVKRSPLHRYSYACVVSCNLSHAYTYMYTYSYCLFMWRIVQSASVFNLCVYKIYVFIIFYCTGPWSSNCCCLFQSFFLVPIASPRGFFREKVPSYKWNKQRTYNCCTPEKDFAACLEKCPSSTVQTSVQAGAVLMPLAMICFRSKV